MKSFSLLIAQMGVMGVMGVLGVGAIALNLNAEKTMPASRMWECSVAVTRVSNGYIVTASPSGGRAIEIDRATAFVTAAQFLEEGEAAARERWDADGKESTP